MRWSSRVLTAVAGAVLAVASGGPVLAAPPAPGGPAPLAVADVARLSADATQRSIVILRNQHPELPARGATAGSRARSVDGEQAPLRSELGLVHAKDVRAFHLVNAISATISRAESDRLRGNPAVQAVVPGLPIPRPAPPAQEPAAAPPGSAPAAAPPAA